MRILGIETTCDETAAAVVGVGFDGRGEILSNEVLSQIAEHAAYGGVVPEIAARAHVEVLDRLVARALKNAGCTARDLDGIAVAAGPGLIGGVLVGLTTAKAMALVTRKPLMAVNHLEAHALTARLTDGIGFPYLLLLASGGHTQLVAVKGVGDYVRIGTTIDDAIGEAFDKVAKMLGLPYPGRAACGARGRAGQPGALRPAAPHAGAGGTELLPLRPQDRRADRGRAHRAAHRKRRVGPVRELPGRRHGRGGRPHPRRPAVLP
jgi:N6-L-threonylcarbamoyladenine synthase